MSSVELASEEKYEIAVSYGTIIGTGALALVVCLLRLYARKYIIRSFGIDDWACVVGLITVTTFNGIGIAVVRYGAGKHVENVSTADLEIWYLLYYICICMYLFISFAVKSSIIFFLRRVFPTPYIRHCTMGMLVFLVLFTISGSFLAAFQCNPPKYSFSLPYLMAADRADHCFSTDISYNTFMYQAVLLFACDIFLLILPFPALFRLNLSHAKSTALLAVFSSGIVACIAPAVRFKSIQFYKSGSSDVTYASASSLYWMAIEYNLGMVAGSLTALRPYLARMGILGSTNRSTDASYGRNGFTPSYPLQNHGSRPWNSKDGKDADLSTSGRRGKQHRVQGDSVLEHTVVGDRSSEDVTDETRIVKTQIFTVSEENNHTVDSIRGKTRW